MVMIDFKRPKSRCNGLKCLALPLYCLSSFSSIPRFIHFYSVWCFDR